ncbi:MAG TPA: hypothetical protein VIN67_05915 [Desulfobaccales bacterium]
MIKRILERFRRDRGLHKATLRIDFYPQNQVTPHVFWHHSQDQENDTIPLMVYSYARILYELSELNEGRVARELIGFLDQVCRRVLINEGLPRRPRLNLGTIRLVADPAQPAVRSYRVEFYELPDGSYRLEYQGSLGKEGFYLPGAFLALLQSCLDQLKDESLKRLARGLSRLHNYYRFRRDFWDGGALISGPTFALGKEELRPEEAEPEV